MERKRMGTRRTNKREEDKSEGLSDEEAALWIRDNYAKRLMHLDDLIGTAFENYRNAIEVGTGNKNIAWWSSIVHLLGCSCTLYRSLHRSLGASDEEAKEMLRHMVNVLYDKPEIRPGVFGGEKPLAH